MQGISTLYLRESIPEVPCGRIYIWERRPDGPNFPSSEENVVEGHLGWHTSQPTFSLLAPETRGPRRRHLLSPQRLGNIYSFPVHSQLKCQQDVP